VPSAPLLRIFIPSGEKETDQTAPLWDPTTSPTTSSVSASQTLIVDIPDNPTFATGLSTEIVNPETIFVPSGEMATLWRWWTEEPALTLPSSLRVPVASEIGVRGSGEGSSDGRNGRPASQTLIVPSKPPLTSFVPSGEKSTKRTPHSMYRLHP
jgi:hypothetical protein